MNNDTFTIKFKGVLDRVATRKSLESDISKMEKLLKPKKTSLGSTRDIIKSNLGDKKRELNKQNKYEALREKVEKFRLSETRKLVKQGMGFEKARKEAHRRSLMSDKDRRKLEYSNIKQEKKAIRGKALAKVITIAIGTAIGKAIFGAFSKATGGAFNFAKKSVEESAQTKRDTKISSKMFSKGEYSTLYKKIAGTKSFEKDTEIADFLRKSAVLKSSLKNLGLAGDKNALSSVVDLASKLKSSGLYSGNDDAIGAVSELLKGNASGLFSMLNQLEGVGDKYNDLATMSFEASSGTDPASRIRVIEQILADLPKDLLQDSSSRDAIGSNLAKFENSVQNLTAKILEPALVLINKLLDWINNFNLQTSIIDPIKGAITSIFSLDALIARLRSILPSWAGGDSGASLKEIQERDSSTTAPH
ncbi:hypothetical protein DB313_06225 (plasmid) [Borrelia turcica IST7]|uniref:Uncharacterized protein n=1 Tax=Borrelia turcica IST7 TaxID=1104446 RepID=A0A386PNQ1_9SPIR|nr:DUF759 family protein [Borrelia turcica]AYE37096.1 hypothetical protein DB313_06225 [Borrelia turcica IST7]